MPLVFGDVSSAVWNTHNFIFWDVQSISLVARRLLQGYVQCTLLWSQEKLALTTCGLLTQDHAAISKLGALEVVTLL